MSHRGASESSLPRGSSHAEIVSISITRTEVKEILDQGHRIRAPAFGMEYSSSLSHVARVVTALDMDGLHDIKTALPTKVFRSSMF